MGLAGLGGKAGLLEDEFPKLPLVLNPSELLPLTEALLPAEEGTSCGPPAWRVSKANNKSVPPWIQVI